MIKFGQWLKHAQIKIATLELQPAIMHSFD